MRVIRLSVTDSMTGLRHARSRYTHAHRELSLHLLPNHHMHSSIEAQRRHCMRCCTALVLPSEQTPSHAWYRLETTNPGVFDLCIRTLSPPLDRARAASYLDQAERTAETTRKNRTITACIVPRTLRRWHNPPSPARRGVSNSPGSPKAVDGGCSTCLCRQGLPPLQPLCSPAP